MKVQRTRKALKKMIATTNFYLLFLMISALLGGYLYLNGQFGKLPSAEEVAAYSKLPYYEKGRFLSATEVLLFRDKVSGGSAGPKRLILRSPNAPKEALPLVKLNQSSFPETPANFAFHWLGHSSLILELAGKRLIFDPVFGNAAPIPFVVPRYDPPAIERDQLPPLDYIVITHNHYDHLEKKTIRKLKTGHFIVPLGVGAVLRGWGVAEKRITELGWGESFEQGDLTITAVDGIHFSGRRLSDRDRTLWTSYVIQSNGKKIFWSGDVGYGEHFARHGKQYGPFDLVALEIDGWNSGWPQSHLFPHQVAQAADDLGTKQLLPIHWGVFDLALHPWRESIELLLKETEGRAYTTLTPQIGQRVGSQDVPTNRWWRGVE